jgi:DNA polymerase III alpha subunit
MYFPLHNLSYYSLMQALPSVGELVRHAASHGLPGLALTDHMSLSGVVEFFQACREKQLHPVIGAELLMEDQTRLVVLCRNDEGYRNLCHLLTRTTHEITPVAWDRLRRHAQGLTALTGGREGLIPCLIRRGLTPRACREAAQLASWFEGCFYVELFYHERRDSLLVSQLALWAAEEGWPVVATAPSHYLSADQHQACQVLASAGTLTLYGQTAVGKRRRGLFSFRDSREMTDLFSWCPEALANSGKIANECQLTIFEGI